MATDQWDIVFASYSRSDIDVFAEYLATLNVPCRVSEPQPPTSNEFTLLVPREQVNQIDALLDWTLVTEDEDALLASLTASRLFSEGILARTEEASGTSAVKFKVYVPSALKEEAEILLNLPQMSDAELTAFALSQPVEGSDDL
jgi:hypothetical protein